MKRIQVIVEISKERLKLMEQVGEIKEHIEFDLVRAIAEKLHEEGLIPLIEEKGFDNITRFKKTVFVDSGENLKNIYEKIEFLRRIIPPEFNHKIEEIKTLLKN